MSKHKRRARQGNTPPQLPAAPQLPPRLRPVAQAISIAASGIVLFGAPPQQALAQTPSVQAAQAMQLAPQRFSIPPGALAPALRSLASTANLLLTFTEAQTAGKFTDGVSGDYTPQAALSALLAGTGLQAVPLDGGGYVLHPLAAPSPVTSPAGGRDADLPAVMVRAQAARPGDLPEAYAGGQVARGGRLGLLGNVDFMETPFSTVSYTEDRINDVQARDIGSVISATDASVYVAQSLGIQESFLVRGLEVNAYDITLNGLVGMAPYMRGSTEMVERLEVLKGPSAMLKGMPPGGSVGGSVNMVSKRAGDEPLTRLTATYKSDAQLGLHADVGRRLGDSKQFGVRFNGVYRDGDTAVEDQTHKMALGALALDWRGERVRISADLYRQRERLEGVDYFGISSIDTAVRVLPEPAKGDRNLAAPWMFNTNISTVTMARAEWDLSDDAMAYVAYGWRESSYDALIGDTELLNNAGDLSTTLVRQYSRNTNRTGETGIQGRTSSAGIEHAWSLAATIYDQKGGFRNTRFSTESNVYRLDYGMEPDLSDFSIQGVPITGKNSLNSIALADRMSFLEDRVQLTLGLRHQKIKTTSISTTTGASTISYEKSALSPSLALLVKLKPRLSAYGSYIQGLSKGSTAPATAMNAGEVLPPIKTRQYELGAKYDFGHFAATAALFQIGKPSSYTDPGTRIFAANGEQRSRGLELSIFGAPWRSVRLMGGIAYLETTLRDQLNDSNNGNQATGVPRIVARLGVETDIAAVPGLTFTGLISHTGTRYATADNRLSLAPYTIFNAGARYAARMAGTPVILRAGIDNLTNKAYWSGSWQGSGDTGLGGGLGAPRTIALSASVNF